MSKSSKSSKSFKFAVMIPTYNEIESIKKIIDQINQINIEDVEIRILVIDDNSPDGTSNFVASLGYSNVEILNRPVKDGLGNAYKAAISHLLKDGSNTHLVSMDADGSHRAIDLEKMIRVAIENPDSSLILGSRWVPGGGIVNWPFYRKWLSKAGTKYARWALKMQINDLTGGFRIYPRLMLEKLDLRQITSNGYCYQIEMAFAVSHLKKSIIEVPITFVERELGVSKMSQRIVLEAMLQVTRWGLVMRIDPIADKLHYVK